MALKGRGTSREVLSGERTAGSDRDESTSSCCRRVGGKAVDVLPKGEGNVTPSDASNALKRSKA